jgi:hypothetical protein
MASITTQNINVAVAKLVAQNFMPAVYGNLVMGQLVNRDYEATLANFGDVVNVTIAPQAKANNIIEAGTVTPQVNNPGSAQVQLNRHFESTFYITDIARALASIDTLRMYMESSVISIAEQIETDCTSTYGQLNALTAVGSANTAITEATVDAAETSLFNAKIPQNEPKYLIVNGSTYSTLRQTSRFTEFQMTGPSGQPSPMITGQLVGMTGANGAFSNGTLKGLGIFRSQYVQKVSTTTYNMCFHKNALALAMRTLPSPGDGFGVIVENTTFGGYGMQLVMSYDPTALQMRVTAHAFYGVGVLRNNFGLQVLS